VVLTNSRENGGACEAHCCLCYKRGREIVGDGWRVYTSFDGSTVVYCRKGTELAGGGLNLQRKKKERVLVRESSLLRNEGKCRCTVPFSLKAEEARERKSEAGGEKRGGKRERERRKGNGFTLYPPSRFAHARPPTLVRPGPSMLLSRIRD